MARSRYDHLLEIARPIHVHGARTAQEFEDKHTRVMRDNRAALPTLNFYDPWPAPDGAIPWIAGGKWIVTCECGNAASASPEWDVARCFECGAVFRNLVWPPNREAIEKVLLVRGATQRAWKAPETIEELMAENFAHDLRPSI